MDHALAYAKVGLPVFPVWEPVGIGVCSCSHGAADVLPNGDKHSKGKHPRSANGLTDATTDLEQIHKWWTQWPNANIGIRTGDGIGVVDLDGPEGLASGRSMNLISPVRTITGNGEQLWYLVPEGQKLITRKANKLAPGVDTRGTGGYVLVPPSLHPNGKRYCWAGSPIARDLLPPLPTQFIEQKKTLPGLIKRNEAGWETEAIKEMQNGHVHNTLIRVLGKFRQHNFSEEGTFAILQPHALENGKPYEGLRGKIAEFWARYPAPQGLGGTSKSEDIDDFLANRQEVEWICEPFVARKSIGFVAGLPETQKTWLCIDFAVAAAAGNGLWAGLFPVTGCKTMFIDQERPREETQRRLDGVIAARGIDRKTLKGRLVVKCGTTIQLDIDSSFQAFRSELLESRPELIVVDSLATIHKCSENDKMEMQAFFEKVKQLRNEIGCAFVFIHHENKNAYPNGEPQGEPNMGTLSGTTGIPAAAEFCMIVRKTDDNTSLAWHVKSTMRKKSKPFYVSVVDTPEGMLIRGLND